MRLCFGWYSMLLQEFIYVEFDPTLEALERMSDVASIVYFESFLWVGDEG